VDGNAVQTHLARREVPARLERLADALDGLNYFDRERVEEVVRGMAEEMEIEAGELIHPSRVALTGGTVSPDIFQVIVLLGKGKTVERLRKGARIAKS